MNPQEELQEIEAWHSMDETKRQVGPKSFRDGLRLAARIKYLEKKIRDIQGHCGHPDAAEGCRIILKKSREALTQWSSHDIT